MKKTLSFILLISMAFVLCGCSEDFEPIQKDDMRAAIEKYFGYEEGKEFELLEDYTLEPTDQQKKNGLKESFELECSIKRIGWDEDPESPFFVYYVFKTKEEAQEYYNHWKKYEGWGDYHDLDCRYDVNSTKGLIDIFGNYYSDRMCFQIYTLGQEDKDTAIELLESLNLPATS